MYKSVSMLKNIVAFHELSNQVKRRKNETTTERSDTVWTGMQLRTECKSGC